jgi:hypothetical protein
VCFSGDSFVTKLSVIPTLLINATTNHANPMHASNVSHPTEGILKNRAALFSAQSIEMYTRKRADTAQTNACEIAGPMTNPLDFT